MPGQVVGGAHPGAHIVVSFALPTDFPSFGRANLLHPDCSWLTVRKLRIASIARLAHVPIASVDRANRLVQIKFGSRRVHAGDMAIEQIAAEQLELWTEHYGFGAMRRGVWRQSPTGTTESGNG